MEKMVSLLRNKKGISGIIVTLIMVVLSIVAITIVWGVIKNTIDDESSKISVSQLRLDLEIKAAYMDGLDGGIVSVKRNPGGDEITGINFIFSDGSNSMVVKKATTLGELEGETFTFTSLEIPGITAGDLISIAPIYELGGEETSGTPTDSSPIGNIAAGGGGGPPASCGDGTIGVGEQCDDNDANPGDGCSDTCQIESGYSCIGEPSVCTLGVTCGDGAIGFGEQCDDNNPDPGDGCSDTCQIEGGYSCTGTPSVCTPDNPPSSCDGVWNPGSEDPEVECDDGEITCLANCLCPSGDVPNPDDLGGCIKEPSLNSGTINSVWPSGAIKYIDSPNLPIEAPTMQSYIGKYVNFSSIVGCFGISYAEYLPEYLTSYIRTEIVMVGIGPSDGYEIWNSDTCGA
jgi:cysteine-rich repeat protein